MGENITASHKSPASRDTPQSSVAQEMTSATVSFIIAAHNEEKYIAECIDSCLAQTYPYLEVCITDDGSTDSTWEKLTSYSGDSRVKLARFSENRGKVAAFNSSFSMATGAFTAIMGADDICDADRIKHSLESIGDNGLVFGAMRLIDDSGERIPHNRSSSPTNLRHGDSLSFDTLLRAPCVFGGTILGRTDALNKVFPLNTNLSHEDWWIPLKVSSFTSVIYVDFPMISYRQHAGQTSRLVGQNLKDYHAWLKLKLRTDTYYDEVINHFYLNESQMAMVAQQKAALSLYRGNLSTRLRSLLILLTSGSPSAWQIAAAFHPRLHYLLLNIWRFARHRKG